MHVCKQWIHRFNPAVALILLANVAAVAEEARVTGPQVVARFVEATGGKEAYDRVKSFHVKGSYQIEGLDAEGTIELFYSRPDQMLFRIELPGIGKYARGLSGERGWAVEPGKPPSSISGGALVSLRTQAERGFSLLPGSAALQVADPVELVEFEGRPTHRVTIRFADSTESYSEFYDVETGRLTGRIETSHQPSGPTTIKGWPSEYKTFAGVTIPTKWKHEAGPQKWTAVYHTVEMNEVDPMALVPPAEVQAQWKD